MDFMELKEFAFKIRQKLYSELNGRIRFTVFESQNSISFTIDCKDVSYQTLLTDVSDLVYEGKPIDAICEDIMKDYKSQVLKVFFKSDYKKKRDAERSLGLLRKEVAAI